MDPLFAWIHLSDLHIGHGDAGHVHDQTLVLRALREDIARMRKDDRVSKPDVVLVTGDIAWAGKAEEYMRARAWLDEVAGAAGVDARCIHVVPGNHDVDLTVPDRDAVRLVRALRAGDEQLDEALVNDSRHLIGRQQPYLAFAAGLAPKCAELFWVAPLDARGGLRVRLCGLNTALLSTEKDDHGKLRLGARQIDKVIEGSEGELIVVLSHHPFRGGWLAKEDEARADAWMRNHAHIHLSGHTKDAGSECTRTGSGEPFLRLVAGAAHRGPGEPPQHGYALGAVFAHADGTLRARIWPRRWAERLTEFRADMHTLPDGATHADHDLGFRLAAPSVAVAVPMAVAVPAPEPLVSTARLPATNREMFGRDAELAWLDACWKEGVRVASIVAFGGVGKSALVNAWVRDMDRDGWRGAQRIYGWSFYSQGTDRLTSSDAFFANALKWFGDPDPTQGSPWDKGERLAKLVRRERALLILDGVEPLQWGPGVQQGKLKDPALEALIKELGAQNKGLCLITTRIGLTDLEALSGDKVRTKDLASLSPEAGAELLKARGAKGTAEELREAAKEYDGHGLALTLLGSYLEDVAKGDIRCRKEIGPLLVPDVRQGEHARRVMVAYEKELGKPDVAILHMLGLFDRPVDEDEIAALRAEPVVPGLTDGLAGVGERAWNKVVAKLKRVELLADEQNNTKLDTHPLVREHFGEQLKREQPEAWREGHRRLYEYLKNKAKELPETIEEMAPLYAAVVHGCQAGKNQEALKDVHSKRIRRGGEGFSIHKLGAFGSEVAVLSAFFDLPWERLAPGLSEPDQALVLSDAGFALRALGRLSEAAGLMRLGLERRIAQENWENAAIAASNLSDLLQAHGELSEALAQARKGVELADKSGDSFRRMIGKTTLAAVLHAMGLRGEAAAQFEEAERMQKEWQPAYPLLYSVQGFRRCDLLLDQGRDTEVRGRAAQTLRWVEAQRWLLDVALDHLSLGRALLLALQRGVASDLTQAASHLYQAVDGLRHAGGQEFLPLGLLARAALHTHTHAFAEARHDLDDAFSIATRCGFRLHEADAQLAYTRLALAEGDPAAACDHLARARAIVQATGYHRRDAELAELTRSAHGGALPEDT